MNARALLVSLSTGLRIGDVLALRHQDINGRMLTTVCQKTGKPFAAELPPNLANGLAEWNGSEWCFPSPRNPAKHRTRQAVWHDIKCAARKAGLSENITPHSARKIFAVDRFRKKGLNDVQIALQHDRPDTTLIYAFSNLLQGTKKEKPNECSDSQHLVDKFISALVEALGGAETVRRALGASLNCLFSGCSEGGAQGEEKNKTP